MVLLYMLHIHTYILGYYELPVSCLVEPSADRCLRPPDRTFIDSLKQEMVQNPTSIVSPILGVLCLKKDEAFDKKLPASYNYETIGGNNSRIALQELELEHPTEKMFQTRLVAVFIGLCDEMALWLAAKQNRATGFTYEMTTQDKVCYVAIVL